MIRTFIVKIEGNEHATTEKITKCIEDTLKDKLSPLINRKDITVGNKIEGKVRKDWIKKKDTSKS